MKKIILLSLCWAGILPAMELPKKELTQEQLEQQIVESIALQLIHEIHNANGLGDIEKRYLRIMALLASEQFTDALSDALEKAWSRLVGLGAPYSLDRAISSFPFASQIMVELTWHNDLSNPKVDKNHLFKKVASAECVTWIKKLLKLTDVNINQTNTKGETVLHLAAKNGRIKVVECLVKHGADINAQDLQKNTALIWATENDHLEVVKYLVNHGADLDKQNRMGEKALDVALVKNHTKIVELLEQAMKSQQSARN